MKTFEHLRKAPIQEGLIDLRCTFNEVPSQAAFEQLGREIVDDYPKSEMLHKYEAAFGFGGGAHSTNSASSFAGLRFERLDKSYVFQAQVTGFTVSKLSPYTKWEDLRSEAERLWRIFDDLLVPTTIVRSAVRYINRFSVPSTSIKLSDYFHAAPSVPTGIPQGVSNYVVRLQIPEKESGSVILLTQLMEEALADKTTFVLDIDVFNTKLFDVSEQQWWDMLETLRELKNTTFFSSLTKKTLELFR